jgi:hypothetical protein
VPSPAATRRWYTTLPTTSWWANEFHRLRRLPFCRWDSNHEPPISACSPPASSALRS